MVGPDISQVRSEIVSSGAPNAFSRARKSFHWPVVLKDVFCSVLVPVPWVGVPGEGPGGHFLPEIGVLARFRPGSGA